MLKISLDGGSRERVLSAFRRKGPRIAEVLRGKLTSLMYMLSAYVVQRKLSGQVLHRRTGILAGSVHAVPAVFEGLKIVAGVEAGASGPAALYAAAHELGGIKAYDIIATRARALAWMNSGGHKIFAKRVLHPAMTARPFLSTSLDENANDIRAQLQSALDEELDTP
jgi:hypothetical protein